MQKFRYIRDGTHFRAWPPELCFSIGGVTFEQYADGPKEALVKPWPFIAWCDVEAEDIEQALRIGHLRCSAAADAATLITGYRIDLGIEGVRPGVDGADLSGIVQTPAALRFRSDNATESEQRALVQQAESVRQPSEKDPQYSAILHAMRWYSDSVRETDAIDRYIKLFVTLDMSVPRGRQPFADRAADLLAPQFPTATVTREHIRECLSELAKVRNDLFHAGIADARLPAATQILERIVRALLRRKIGLTDELQAQDLFRRIDGYNVQREGGVFGWLPSAGEITLASAPLELRVGDPDLKDGKHYLYAREAGVTIRMMPTR